MSLKWDRNRKVLDSLFHGIGGTPLVKLNNIAKSSGSKASILGKLEYFNPTGSLKDRIYLEMTTKAIESNELKPGMEIIEASTGNAGISCVFIGRVLGYGVTIVMPAGMSQERMKIIQAYGANLILTPGGESDVDLCIKRIAELMEASPGKYWFPDQFRNPENPNAHYRTTGPEIWQQAEGKVDCFIASQGSGGTLTGVGRFLKEKNPSIALYAVEPKEAAILARRKWGTHKIEGIGDGFVPVNLDLSLLRGVVTVSSEEAIATARRLSLEEGVFCGISSGCNVAAALKVARVHPEFRIIVTMINDTGQRYLSTELCGEKKEIEVPEREHPLDEYSIQELDKHQARWEIIE